MKLTFTKPRIFQLLSTTIRRNENVIFIIHYIYHYLTKPHSVNITR